MRHTHTVAMLLILFTFLSGVGAALEGVGEVTAVPGVVEERNITYEPYLPDWGGLYGHLVEGAGPVEVAVGANEVVEAILPFVEDPPCSSYTLSLYVLAVNGSNVTPPLERGNLSLFSIRPSLEETFTRSTTFSPLGQTIYYVPTTYLLSSGEPSSAFREGYLNDAEGKVVFVATISQDTPGWNGTPVDFQLLLPPGNYTLSVDAHYTCEEEEDKEHSLSVSAPSTYELPLPGGNFPVRVINNGDYVERYIEVSLLCPSPVECGSATISALSMGSEVQVLLPVSSPVEGTFGALLKVSNDYVEEEQPITLIFYCEDCTNETVNETVGNETVGENETLNETNETWESFNETLNETMNETEVGNETVNETVGEELEGNETAGGEVAEEEESPSREGSRERESPQEELEEEQPPPPEEGGGVPILLAQVENPLPEYVEGSIITLLITDGEGNPVEGALIEWEGGQALTGRDGRAQVEVPYDGLYRISKEGYNPITLQLPVVKKAYIDLPPAVEAKRLVEVEVVDSKGRPVPNARVVVGDKILLTSPEGKAVVAFEEPGLQKVLAYKEGYKAAATMVKVEGASPLQVVVPELSIPPLVLFALLLLILYLLASRRR